LDTRVESSSNNEGTAHGRKPAVSNAVLTQVGPGTPCGEFMRRYWQPVLKSENVTTRPREIRILGEDLIVFRDKQGRPGLLYPRCMHRGTSLFYGKVENEGIRCCYHGWLFAVDGTCLDQPCEPEGGLQKDLARQPWYPVEERYGLVWAYMGPPSRKPVLPHWDVLENLEPGETYAASDESWGTTRDGSMPVAPYSWLHMNDNIMDPFHVQVLHSTFSTIQFVESFKVMPKVEFEYIDNGVIYKAYRKLDDGREVDRVSTFMMPNIMSVPNTQHEHGRSNSLGFVVPVDDSHCRIVSVRRTKTPDAEYQPFRTNGKTWGEMTIEERQDFPNDFEAQMGQGPISLHSDEHLATSDKGIAMQRRMLTQQIKLVAEGGDPIGIVFDESDSYIKVPSGNFYR
jgi:phenylpropionate dioxygenase-like ring-hydroxylating dioxygenase large terminal subunit